MKSWETFFLITERSHRYLRRISNLLTWHKNITQDDLFKKMAALFYLKRNIEFELNNSDDFAIRQ